MIKVRSIVRVIAMAGIFIAAWKRSEFIGGVNLKSPLEINERASSNNPGDFLLSHTVTRAVPSAPAGLTSVFGMGTGVTLPTKSPENLWIQNPTQSDFESVFGLGTLVFVRPPKLE